MDMHFGIVAFGLIGGLIALISLIMPYRPIFRQYFFVFLFTVVPLGGLVLIPLGLMFVVGRFKKRAPYGFGAWLARRNDGDIDVDEAKRRGSPEGIIKPVGSVAPDGGIYIHDSGVTSKGNQL